MHTKLTRLTLLLAALLLAVPALAACGGDDESSPDTSTHTAANGDEFNDADVAFVTDMIPHHAQATEMVNMARGRGLDPEVQQIADGILATQTTEIEAMVDWLTAWDQPVPATSQDHAHADGGDTEMDADMPGMMNADEMADLGAARGEEFQTMWLEMMIEHHEGAIEIARTEVEDGTFPDTVAMAKEIESSQTAEVERMQGLLDS